VIPSQISFLLKICFRNFSQRAISKASSHDKVFLFCLSLHFTPFVDFFEVERVEASYSLNIPEDPPLPDFLQADNGWLLPPFVVISTLGTDGSFFPFDGILPIFVFLLVFLGSLEFFVPRPPHGVGLLSLFYLRSSSLRIARLHLFCAFHLESEAISWRLSAFHAFCALTLNFFLRGSRPLNCFPSGASLVSPRNSAADGGSPFLLPDCFVS